MKTPWIIGLLLLVCALGIAARADDENIPNQTVGEGGFAEKFDETVIGGPQIKQFFTSYIFRYKYNTRREFETQDEYEKRLPPALDFTKTYYFSIDYSPWVNNYYYNMDNKALVMFAGGCEHFIIPDQAVVNLIGNRVPLIIHNEYEDRGTYEASNAYGKTVTVQKSWDFDYVFNLNNIGMCRIFNRNCLIDPISKITQYPMTMDGVQAEKASESAFIGYLNMEPKIAEKFSKAFEFIIGVQFDGYQYCDTTCVFASKPTMRDPVETSLHAYMINASMASLIIRDKDKHTVFVKFPIVN